MKHNLENRSVSGRTLAQRELLGSRHLFGQREMTKNHIATIDVQGRGGFQDLRPLPAPESFTGGTSVSSSTSVAPPTPPPPLLDTSTPTSEGVVSRTSSHHSGDMFFTNIRQRLGLISALGGRRNLCS